MDAWRLFLRWQNLIFCEFRKTGLLAIFTCGEGWAGWGCCSEQYQQVPVKETTSNLIRKCKNFKGNQQSNTKASKVNRNSWINLGLFPHCQTGCLKTPFPALQNPPLGQPPPEDEGAVENIFLTLPPRTDCLRWLMGNEPWARGGWAKRWCKWMGCLSLNPSPTQSPSPRSWCFLAGPGHQHLPHLYIKPSPHCFAPSFSVWSPLPGWNRPWFEFEFTLLWVRHIRLPHSLLLRQLPIQPQKVFPPPPGCW